VCAERDGQEEKKVGEVGRDVHLVLGVRLLFQWALLRAGCELGEAGM
jgi:hypothetical protein